MSDRSEWPSDAKLEELRTQGVVLRSPLSLALVGGATVGAVLLLRMPKITASFTNYFSALRQEDSIGVLLSELIPSLGSTLLILALAVIFSVAIFGLLQTKFLWILSLCLPRFDRLAFNWCFSVKNLFASLVRVLAALIIGCGLAGILAWIGLGSGLGLFNQDRPYLLNWGQKTSQAMLLGFVLVGIAGAVVSWVCSYWLFLFDHKMTRAEIDSERD